MSNMRIKAIWRVVSSTTTHIIMIFSPWKIFRMLLKIQWWLCWWWWSSKLKPGWSKIMGRLLGPVSPTQWNKASTTQCNSNFQEDCTGRCCFFSTSFVFQFVFLFCILWNIQVLWRYLTYDYLTYSYLKSGTHICFEVFIGLYPELAKFLGIKSKVFLTIPCICHRTYRLQMKYPIYVLEAERKRKLHIWKLLLNISMYRYSNCYLNITLLVWNKYIKGKCLNTAFFAFFQCLHIEELSHRIWAEVKNC